MKKFLNVPIDEELHTRFKILVAKRKSTMEKLVEEALHDLLKKFGEDK
jgi:predicted HicB family RNase H-like nuclease